VGGASVPCRTKDCSSLTGSRLYLSSALNPPAYYPPGYARLKLAAVLLPIAIIFAITPPAVFAHAGSFALGAGFFGAKFIMQGVQWLLKTFPNWPEQLDLSNSLLLGVPTDAQLAIVRHSPL
jgi:hypothetical protein